ncbi:ABC transporter permease [Paenibacillus darwinianus]|uniref:ABC transporter permease n=1 Tax=Paenibacillus darwinianus TaxID=1380763 RepID=A0A9W5RZP7_9BACL|nr:ABC transporter permease [Paenibacillus darwinianus]EXX87333.1 ABC transporter permease [Paenibacillus darwinianus]EXX87477.1 ABC transporter permease [Paenibacillus darwinianus]
MKAMIANKWNKRTRKAAVSFIRAAVLAVLAYQLLYPLLYMLSMALRRPEEAMDPSVIWIPKSFTLSNFTDTLRVMDFWDAFANSMYIGIGSGLLDVFSSAFVAYGFARFRFPFAKVLFTLVILTLMVPVQTIILPLYAEMKYFDAFGLMGILSAIAGGPDSISLVGNYSAFYLPSLFAMGLRSGLYIFIFRQFFSGMPKELEDAAYVDGYGPFKTFFFIMLPNARNAIITVFLFSFVWHWNEYYMSNLLLGNLKKNFAIALSSLRVDLESVVNVQTISDPLVIVTRIQAGALLSILPLVILYLVTQRYFTDSVENVGIK